MKHIMSEVRGDYSQTIVIGGVNNTVKVSRGSKIIYDGPATAITDEGNVLKFKDINLKDYTIVKYELDTSSC